MNFGKRVFSIFIALFICVCVVLPVLRANNFFRSKERLVENEKTASEDRENESSQEQVKEIQNKSAKKDDKKSVKNSISIPKAVVIEKQKKAPSEIKNKLEQEQEVEKKAILSGNIPQVEKAETLNNTVVHAPVKALNVQSEIQQRAQDNNENSIPPSNPKFNTEVVKYEIPPSSRKKSCTPSDQTGTPSGKFDFEEYSKSLINIAGLKDGERIPLIVFDGQNYEEGLRFYLFQMVARPSPKPLPKEPYYFIVNESGIMLVNTKPPYEGTFPPATAKDILHFQGLLSKSVYYEMTKDTTQFQVFYAPTDMRMEKTMRCKLKNILDSFQEKLNNVAKVRVEFKRVGDGYLLIVKSFQKMNGQTVIVDDPDNERFASTVGLNNK